jgi:rare lipoprotein A
MIRHDLPRAARRWLAPIAAIALFGATGSGHAQQEVTLASGPVAAAAPSDRPVFVPSAAASFDEAFTDMPAPEGVELPDHAVDITAIEPAAPSATSLGSGVASYYGSRFAGRPTASGEAFDPQQLTAAHRTLPFGSLVRVTNPRNGRSVVVRINDRGPYAHGRTIDLSRAAADQIGIVNAGHGTVELELLEG